MPLQILRVGKLAIIGAPVEFTTMAGRRVRAAVLAALGGAELGWRVVLAGLSLCVVQIVLVHCFVCSLFVLCFSHFFSSRAGLANTYSSYCATPEEYAAQRYEAASTLYGPHTLDAYVARYLARAATPPSLAHYLSNLIISRSSTSAR